MKKLLITLLLLTSATAFAAEGGVNNPGPTGGVNNAPVQKQFTPISNPLKAKSLEALVNSLVDLALKLGVIVATLAIIWTGFLFIMAQGNGEKISDAREALKWVLIGIAILFSSKIIVEVIRGTLGQFTNI